MNLNECSIQELRAAIKYREKEIADNYRIFNFLTASQEARLEKFAEEIDLMKAEIKRRKEIRQQLKGADNGKTN